MNIKSLLIGSAAALAAVSLAYAAPPPGGGGGIKSNEVGVITADPFELAALAVNETLTITNGLDIGAQATLGDDIIIQPDGGTILHLASNETSIIQPEGDGGMKKPNLLLKEGSGRY